MRNKGKYQFTADDVRRGGKATAKFDSPEDIPEDYVGEDRGTRLVPDKNTRQLRFRSWDSKWFRAKCFGCKKRIDEDFSMYISDKYGDAVRVCATCVKRWLDENA